MRTAVGIVLFLAASAASAQNCTIDLSADDAMKFDKAEVTVSAACPAITINLVHAGKLPVAAMGHNVVIAGTDTWQALAQDAAKAGAAAHYVPAGDARVIAATQLVGGGEKTSATIPAGKLVAGGAYTFFCSFPGHWALMKGTLKVE
jgi:azurin